MRVRGIDFHVQERGSGRPVVWGHGLLGSVAQEDQAAPFSWSQLREGLRILRYDARGHGRSEATLAAEDYRWPELARDLLGLLDALGLRRAVLGGVSMGCATALHAAVLAPARVEALLLVGPPTAWRTRPRQARVYRFAAGLVERVGVTPFSLLGSLPLLATRNATLAAMQRATMGQLRRADRRAVVAALRGAAASDLPPAEALRGLAVPALILGWSDDPVHPVSTAERLAEQLPEARLEVASSSEAMQAWPGRIRSFLAPRPRSPAQDSRERPSRRGAALARRGTEA